jgi:putative membrane protein
VLDNFLLFIFNKVVLKINIQQNVIMYKTLLIVFLLFVSLSEAVVSQPRSGYYHGPGMMWGGGWLGMLMGLMLIGLLIAGVVYFIRAAIPRLQGKHSQSSQTQLTSNPKTAMDILMERFARGEIDEAEFEMRRRRLKDESDSDK